MFVFFFKQKTAYEMRIRDWSSDVCSSDLHLGHGQDDGDLANLLGADQLAREIGAVERLGEEEAERTDDAVHRRHRNARLLLIDLELADLLRTRGVRRAPEPGREPSDVAQIITLRLRPEPDRKSTRLNSSH